MNTFKKFYSVLAFLLLGTLTIMGCMEEESPQSESQADSGTVNSQYEIAGDEYGELAEQALNHWADLDFDAWSEMLADSVDYYFPDGGEGTRTILQGKEEVVGWFKNWNETSGIEQMTVNDSVHFPVISRELLNYSELSDILVMSYFSNEMVYNGELVNIRMNVVSFINNDNQIYRYYTYYDRTPILDVVNENILKTETE